MRQLSASGQQAIDTIARNHGFSTDATLSLLESVINGNGGMAQFSHPEFGGSGQWMRGGMTMIGDMFNNHLKGRVDALCAELSNLVANQPDLVRSGSFQSQNQSGQNQSGQNQSSQNQGGQTQSSGNYGQHQSSGGHGQQQSNDNGNFGNASLFVPGTSGDWWPSDLRWPNSTGAQNNARYAYFAQARRLAIDVGGRVTVYDTQDHQISGFGQQQSGSGTLSFTSQYGLIDVTQLPVTWSDGAARSSSSTASTSSSSSGQGSHGANAHDIYAAIEKLADLKAKGFLSDDEFAKKKAELLARV